MTNAGIWQGRFQFVHNGHVFIFEKELSKFKDKYVAIVNPNPLIPATQGGDFDRFTRNLNPFNYFERMLLWKKVADNSDFTVSIVPCWHGRYAIALENEFLPPVANRSWIIPVAQSDGEANKANDLRSKGENIHEARSFFEEDDAYAAISASKIRVGRENGKDWKKYIPTCISQLTEDLLDNNVNYQYFVVPFIGNTLDIHSLQEALFLLKQSSAVERFIVFAISVMVQNGKKEWIDSNPVNTPWWFKAADNTHSNHNLKFYAKAKMINELMTALGIANYLVTPVFIMEESFSTLSEYNNAFLPSAMNTQWIINKKEKSKNGSGYYKFGFFAYLTNMDANTHTFEASAIDPVISSFFNNEAYHKFLNVDQRKILIDTATRTSLEARVPMIEQSLLGLVGSPNPPERATKYLQQVRTIKNRLTEGWDSEEEFQQDQSKLNDIDNWLRKIV